MAYVNISVTNIDPVARINHARPYVMDLRTAKDFLFTGRRMGAEEALRIGTVNRAADMGGFRNAVTAHIDTHQLSHVSDAFPRQRVPAGLDGAIACARAVG